MTSSKTSMQRGLLMLGAAGMALGAITADAQITRLNVRPDGTQSGATALADLSSLSASDDGRYVAFISAADDLTPGDTNGAHDAFVLDRQTGVVQLITRGYDGAPAQLPDSAGAAVSELRISGDGHTVVFVSPFVNLVAGDANGGDDVFAYDRLTTAMTRLSVGPGGDDIAALRVGSPDVSHDGSVIVYTAMSSVLTGRPDWEVAAVIVDRTTTGRFAIGLGGTPSYLLGPGRVSVSGNGRFVALTTSLALAGGAATAPTDLYLYDRQLATFERISVTTAGQLSEGGFYGVRRPSISYDGRFVVFESDSATLAPPVSDVYSVNQVFLRDRHDGTTTRVSESSTGVGGASDSMVARISADGQYVAFLTDSPRTFSPTAFSSRDAFLWQRTTRTFRHVNIATDYRQSAGSAATAREVWPTNGSDVLFVSGQDNLVNADTNGAADMFVRSMIQPEPVITSITPSQGPRDQPIEVTLTGTGFVPGATAVLIHPGYSWPLALGAVTATSVTATLPAGRGTRVVAVATPFGVAGTTFTSATCGYTVAPATILAPSAGGTYQLHVTVAAGSDPTCPWTVSVPGSTATVNGVAYLTGAGSATLQVGVTPHTLRESRQATVFVAGHSTTVLQAGTSGTPVPATADGESANVTVALADGTATMAFRGVMHAGIVSLFEGGFDPNSQSPKPLGVRLLPQRAVRMYEGIAFDSVSLCLPYRTSDIGEGPVYPSAFRLFRWSARRIRWDDVTTHVDAAENRVCGTSDEGAEFVVAYVESTRYLAEGATSAFFDTRLAILNPGDADASAQLTFLRSGADPLVHALSVPAHSRVTVDPKKLPGLQTAEFSTVLHADRFLVIDRTMTWNASGSGYGSHSETAVAAPSTVWYLAEGATHSGFQLFYLLQNPGSVPTTVRVRYLRSAGAPLEKTYHLAPQSRVNIWVNVENFDGLGQALASAEFSAVLESVDGTPIIVERAMYRSNQGRTFNAGHESIAASTPSTSWFLAEGATGPYFDMFVLIANPTPNDAQVRLSYLLDNGKTYMRTMVAPANARSGVWVDNEQFDGVEGYPLANVAVATTVYSLNDVPLIVERSMWWPGDGSTWHEAHNSTGATTTGSVWAVAEGQVGGEEKYETYLLIANTSGSSGSARVTLYFEDGSTAEKLYDMGPWSRTNVAVGPDFGQVVQGRRFGAVVESLGPVPPPIVVERAMYSSADGIHWSAGTNALATKVR
jgi:Tol biopolymer transport system component